MAKEQTSEESAREILEIFVQHFKLGAGKGLLWNNLQAVWIDRRNNMENLRPGLDFAVERKWLEENNNFFTLTKLGYEEALKAT